MSPPGGFDRRPPITPQFAMRVAILGGVALTLFGILFLRVWFLQVISGRHYLAQASTNRTRDMAIQAPRGEMLDRNGRTLVEKRLGVAVVVSPRNLPQSPAQRRAVLARVSRVLGVSTKPRTCITGAHAQRDTTPRMPLECEIDTSLFQLPYADVMVRKDVPRQVYVYLAERQDQFPGVTIQQIYLRSYPYGTLGAQLFGTIGEIGPAQLKAPRFRGVPQGTIVGQSGLEYTYDRYLRGIDGATRIQVDALGRAKGYERTRQPIQGKNLKLSLDLGLQQAGQQALQTGMQLAHRNHNPARAGAFVALDPRDGEVLAMGSAPSFDPAVFARPLSRRAYARLFGTAANHPQVNRAIAGLYPVGSSFKIVTSSAALATGVITPSTVFDDTGSFSVGSQQRHNAGNAVYGPVSLVQALTVSVDTFFYSLGAQLEADPLRNPNGGALQLWARQYGFGRPTGVDLPGEQAGIVPSPNWRTQQWRDELTCRKRQHTKNCFISDGRPWSTGDNVSLAVGQGDFLATPLQMAVAYAAIENGGTIVRPHVGLAVQDGGRVLARIDPAPVRHVKIKHLAAIQQGLLGAATRPGGTSFDVWQGFPKPVHGKTGTAQHTNRPDQSWYICYIDDPRRPIVIAVTIEDGGFGAEAAAPAARLIASQWYGVKKVVQAGKSRTL